MHNLSRQCRAKMSIFFIKTSHEAVRSTRWAAFQWASAEEKVSRLVQIKCLTWNGQRSCSIVAALSVRILEYNFSSMEKSDLRFTGCNRKDSGQIYLEHCNRKRFSTLWCPLECCKQQSGNLCGPQPLWHRMSCLSNENATKLFLIANIINNYRPFWWPNVSSD